MKNLQSNSNILDSLERFIETRQENFDKECQYLELNIRDMAVEFKQQFPQVVSLSITGSYLHPEFFSPTSDVDFVVTGLQTERYFDAFLFIEERLDREIHLIREEEIPTNLCQRFGQERRVLYEKM
ncbi:MAG: nucleotidyltransferase domain-containing protein [bacterium]